MWIKADKAATITVHGKTIPVSAAWQQVSASFALSSKTEYEMGFTDATYYVYQAQLEQGTFATAWQLAPEDVDKNTEDKISESEKNTDSKIAASDNRTESKISASESRTNGKISDSETRTKEKIEEKNASYAQDTQPTATKIGDQWIDTAHDNAVYYWTGQVWTIAPFGATAIAAEAIYARHILAGAITTEKLAAECITAGKIGANAITAKNIVAGAITTDHLASGSVTADRLSAGCITSNKIVASAITSDKIAANAITANKIAASAVTADKLSVTSLSAITADLGAITSGSINIGTGNFVVDTAGNLTSKGTMSLANNGITYNAKDGLKVAGSISAMGGSLNIGSGNFVVDTAGNLTSKGTMSIGNGGITYTSANGLSVTGSIVAKNMTIYDKIALIDSGQNQNRMFVHYGSGDTINPLIIGDGNSTVDINASLIVYYNASIDGTLQVSGVFTPSGGIAPFTVLRENNGMEGGQITLAAAAVGGIAANLDVFNTSFRLHANGNVVLSCEMTNGLVSVPGLAVTTSVTCKQVIPEKDCTSGYACGNSSHRWNNVYSRTATINTSDRNEKHDIDYDFDVEMFKSLKPCTYMYNVGDRIHYGFIAQDVEQLMQDNNLDYKDFGFLCRDIKMRSIRNANGEEIEVEMHNADGSYQYIYGLRYEEMIAINTRMIQKEISRADEHEKKTRELERMIYNLQFELAKLQE